MAPGCLTKRHILLLGSNRTVGNSGYTRSQCENWVKCQGGVWENELSSETTHIVCEQAVWDEQSAPLQEAQSLASDRRIFFVRLEWLLTTLEESKREKESDHSWTAQSKLPRVKRTKTHKDQEEEVETLADVLYVGTRDHVDERDQAQLDTKHAEEDAAQREREREERALNAREQHRLKLEKTKARFKQSDARNAGAAAFARDHHVFRDETDFVYNLPLTKTDVSTNKNERCTLTIFESNTKPYTYTVNMHQAGTRVETKTAILAIPGTNRRTALYVFRQAFEEKTNVLWKNRDKAFRKDSVHLRAMQKLPFVNRPFAYHVPACAITVEEAIEISDDDAEPDEFIGRTSQHNDHDGSLLEVDHSVSEPRSSAHVPQPETQTVDDSPPPLGKATDEAAPIKTLLESQVAQSSHDETMISNDMTHGSSRKEAWSNTVDEEIVQGSSPTAVQPGVFQVPDIVSSVELVGSPGAGPDGSAACNEVQQQSAESPPAQALHGQRTNTLGRKRLFEEVDDDDEDEAGASRTISL